MTRNRIAAAAAFAASIVSQGCSSGFDADYYCEQSQACEGSSGEETDICVENAESAYAEERLDTMDVIDSMFESCEQEAGCEFVDCAVNIKIMLTRYGDPSHQ